MGDCSWYEENLDKRCCRTLLINPFYATSLSLYPLKTSENQRFSDVFRGVQKETNAIKWVTALQMLQIFDLRQIKCDHIKKTVLIANAKLLENSWVKVLYVNKCNYLWQFRFSKMLDYSFLLKSICERFAKSKEAVVQRCSVKKVFLESSQKRDSGTGVFLWFLWNF